MATSNQINIELARRAYNTMQAIGAGKDRKSASSFLQGYLKDPDGYDQQADMYLYARNTYGKNFTPDTMPTIMSQYKYNQQRTQMGYDPITIKDPYYDPSQYDDDTNEAMQGWFKKYKSLPTSFEAAQFNTFLAKYRKDKQAQNLKDAWKLADFDTVGDNMPTWSQDWKSLGYDYDLNDYDEIRRMQLGMPPKAYLDQYDSTDDEDTERMLTGKAPKKVERLEQIESPGYAQDWVKDYNAGEIEGPLPKEYMAPPTISDSRGNQFEYNGNIDLNARPKVQNSDGSYSTVDSITIGVEEDGKEKQIVIPTVIKDAKGNWYHASDEAAISYFKKTGEYLGKYDSEDEAENFANALHEAQAAQYDQQTGQAKQEKNELEGVTSLPDFADLSKKGAAVRNPTVEDVIRPFGKKVVNPAQFARDNANAIQLALFAENGEGEANSSRFIDPLYLRMNDAELDTYNYYYAKNGRAKADEYFDSIRDRLKERQASENAAQEQQLSEDHPFAYGLPSSILAQGLAQPVEGATNAARNIVRSFTSNEAVPTSEYKAAQLNEAASQGMTKNMPEWAQLAENAGTSIGSNVLQRVLLGPVLGVAAMGLTVLDQGMYQGTQEGGSARQVTANGIFQGALEYAGEKLAFGQLDKIMDGAKKILKGAGYTVGLDMLKQAGTEGLQEFFTQAAQMLADWATMQDQSEVTQFFRNYLKEHPGAKGHAIMATAAEILRQSLAAGGVGFLAGGAMGGAAVAIGRSQNGNVQINKVEPKLLMAPQEPTAQRTTTQEPTGNINVEPRMPNAYVRTNTNSVDRVNQVTPGEAQAAGLNVADRASENTRVTDETPELYYNPNTGEAEEGYDPYYESVAQEWNDAVETVQNHFGTNDLRVDEFNSIKDTLGIDLEEIQSRLAQAERWHDELSPLQRFEQLYNYGVADQFYQPELIERYELFNRERPQQQGTLLALPYPQSAGIVEEQAQRDGLEPTTPTNNPAVEKSGPAIWNRGGIPTKVNVVGYAGSINGGENYYYIDGSKSAVPESELTFKPNQNTAKKAPANQGRNLPKARSTSTAQKAAGAQETTRPSTAQAGQQNAPKALETQRENGKRKQERLPSKKVLSPATRMAQRSAPTQETAEKNGYRPQRAMRRAEQLAHVFGKTVHWEDEITDPVSGRKANGYYDRDNDRLVLSRKVSKGGDSPYAIIAKHELTHFLEGTKAYNELRDYVIGNYMAREVNGQNLYEQVFDRFAKAYNRTDVEKIEQEMVAHFVEDAFFSNDRAIRRFVNENRGLAGQIANWFDDIITRWEKAAGISEDGETLNEIKTARDLWVKAVQESKGSLTNVEKGGTLKVRRGVNNGRQDNSAKAYSVPTDETGEGNDAGRAGRSLPVGQNAQNRDVRRADTGTNGRLLLAEHSAPASFVEAIHAAKEGNPHGAAVDEHTADEYSDMKMFLSPDGSAGIAVKPSGDIVSVFKNPKKTSAKGVIRDLMITAIRNGGIKLDCFSIGGFLPNTYAKYGMVPVARVAFNEEYAPEGWNYERDDHPDVVFMYLDKRIPFADIETGIYTPPIYDLTALPLMDYDEAGVYRDGIADEQNERQYSLMEAEGKDGKPMTFVLAHRQVLSGNNPSEWRKQFDAFLSKALARTGREVSPGNYETRPIRTADGARVGLRTETKGKMQTPMIGSTNLTGWDERYRVKLNAAAHIDELIKASTLKRGNRADRIEHGHPDVGSWSYYSVGFEDESGFYNIDYSVKNLKTGGSFAYNIGDIQKMNSRPYKTGSLTRVQNPASRSLGGESSAKSVQQDNSDVKGEKQFSLPVDDPFIEIAQKWGVIPEGMEPRAARPALARQSTEDTRTRKFYRTVSESNALTDAQAQAVRFQAMVRQYVPLGDKAAVESARSSIKTLGYKRAMERWEGVVAGDRPATKKDIVLGENLLIQAVKMNDHDAMMKLASQIAVEGTRAGQVVQAMKLVKSLTPVGKLAHMANIVRKVNQDLTERGQNAKVTIPSDLKRELIGATSMEEAEKVMDKIITAVANQMPVTWADKVMAWRYMAMLTSGSTHSRNIISNAAMFVAKGLKDGVGVALEKALPKAMRTKAFVSTRSAEYQFAKEDFAEVKSDLQNGGKYGYEDMLNDRRRVFKNKVLEMWRKWNNLALNAEDAWMLRLNYQSSLAQLMRARGWSAEFMQGDSPASTKALMEARQYAMQEAQKATFREANWLASAISRIENKNVGTKLVVGGLLPFKKTPMNIIKRGVEYSPVGLVKGIGDLALKVSRGKMEPAQALDEVAAGLVGTSVVALGWLMASLGVISGGDDDNDKKAYYDKDMGDQSYALRFGDNTYTIDWLSPVAMPLFVGVELRNMMTQKTDVNSAAARFADAITTVSDPVFQLSMLQGVNKALSSYGTTGAGGAIGAAAVETIKGYGSQFVPTIAGQIARTIDPTRRTTYAPKDSSVTRTGEQFFRKQLNRIPVASEYSEPYVNKWGQEEVDTANVVSRLFKNFLSPGYTSEKKVTDVDAEILRLYVITGDAAVLPRSSDGSVKGNNEETFYLKADEFTTYQKTAGQSAFDMLDKLTANRAYSRLDDEQKQKAVVDAYDHAAQTAKIEFFKERGVKYTPPEWYGRELDAIKAGVPIELFYAFKVATADMGADTDADGKAISGTKKAKVEKYIDGLNTSAKIEAALMELAGYTSSTAGKGLPTRKSSTPKRSTGTLPTRKSGN